MIKLTVQAILPKGEDESNKTNVQITTTYVTAIPWKQTETRICLYFTFIRQGGVVPHCRVHGFLTSQNSYILIAKYV